VSEDLTIEIEIDVGVEGVEGADIENDEDVKSTELPEVS